MSKHNAADYSFEGLCQGKSQPPKLVKFGPNADDEMCVGYIAVVKKGQDLTAPGTRDDLFEIFMKQRERLLRKHMNKNSH